MLQTRYQDAAVAYQRAKELGSSHYEHLGMAQIALAQGNYDEALKYMDAGVSSEKTTMDQYWRAAIYSAKGDKDKSLAAVQQALQTGFRDFAVLDASPYFANLRSDPRYQKLIAQYRKQ
jgi:tetratricopeptide (TPR) repeat protein